MVWPAYPRVGATLTLIRLLIALDDAFEHAFDVPTLALEIDVPEPQVFAATLEALDDEELPEWSMVANEKVEANRVAFEHADNAPEWKSAVDETSMDVLREAPGRPDAENVREYVDQTARELVNGDDAEELVDA